jgi:carboxyl-terminal processing protease
MPKRNLIWIAAILAAGLVTILVTRNPQQPADDTDVARLRPLMEAYDLIRQNYVRPVDADILLRGSITGMIGRLDEYSSYVAPGKVEDFEQRMLGTQRGLGLELEISGAQVRVIGPLPGSPAYQAGIGAGDIIASVSGKDLSGLPLAQVQHMLEGPVGTTMDLGIYRDGVARHVSVTTGEFPVESVEGLYRGPDGNWVCSLDDAPGLYYIRIREFVDGTPGQLGHLFGRLGDVRGLVLDLRANPGGMLPSGVGVSNLLIPAGPIVTVVERQGVSRRYQAGDDGKLPACPLVVLVDAGTASAAEIVAGSLKFNGRAVVVGTRTRGKGCVQSMFKLKGDMGQVNLTTSEFLIGDGEPISRRPGCDSWGIDPHEQVIIMPSQIAALARLRQEAQVLADRANPPTDPATREASTMAQRLLRADCQLARAVELLKKPAEMNEILKRAQSERASAKLSQTGPATRPSNY